MESTAPSRKHDRHENPRCQPQQQGGLRPARAAASHSRTNELREPQEHRWCAVRDLLGSGAGDQLGAERGRLHGDLQRRDPTSDATPDPPTTRDAADDTDHHERIAVLGSLQATHGGGLQTDAPVPELHRRRPGKPGPPGSQ